ncbi:MAG: glycosyltransferase family 2 protein [Verrucomicrobiota bacterium]|nr:glycosyltransferase family 2 protein [Verrucomicrobiota bacterium]
MKLSIIVPVYNEETTLSSVIKRILNVKIKDIEIIIVNDCSTDGTADILKKIDDKRIVVLSHDKNRGKGSAIRTAQKEISGDAVVIQDADMEYNPEELPKLLKKFEENKADAVYGSRYSGSELLIDSFWHYMGNKFLTTASNLFSNLHLSDMETCYKMIKADIFKSFDLECNRFGFEPEVTAKLAKLNCRIYEIPIAYEARRFDEGKKIGWKDAVAALWYIFKYNVLK